MEIRLDPMQGYVTKEGLFDQKKAFMSTGVKAAVCYKEVKDGIPVSQDMIRKDEDFATLFTRGLDTVFNDHTTPSEHQSVSLEIVGIPKILCMVLNNEKQYTADERSLRYTKVEENANISKKEVELYNKWLKIFNDVIDNKMGDFYRKFSKTDAGAKKAILKMAQENARYMVGVFMPTTTTYTVPWIQINKIMSYMKKVIDNPLDGLEEMLIPYFKEFINTCIKLDVAITKDSIYRNLLNDDKAMEKVLKKYPEVRYYKGDSSLVYKNNKDVDLSLFANRNPFTGINEDNEYGHNISYNNYESFACLAQEQRHRTINCEMMVPNEFKAYVPPIIEDNEYLVKEWLKDINSLKEVYPQGQLIKVNRCGSIKDILKFVAQERACDRAQLEIEKVYVDDMIPNIYENLQKQEQVNLAMKVKPYVKKLRCAFPGYHCPGVCGHPRIDRKL